MSTKISAEDFYRKVTDASGETLISTKNTIRALVSALHEAAEAGAVVSIADLGTFKPVQRAARMARNPHTDEPVQVPAKVAITFKPSRSYQEAANHG